MRAISLSVKAFGPYWGQQTINFNELGGESIFLITGPTGAGKTTIFDAICYALYGRASGSDRDQDSLRSHFAAMDDQTEVQFHFALNQKEFIVMRSPKQYKKKERGEGYTDDPPKAVLYEVKNGENVLLYSRIKEVNETIESKLGFDYEQFRKMILIPQGEFRKLISENSKEREAVLQNIFHTYFYERMTDQLKTESRTLKDKIAFTQQAIEQEVSKLDWSSQELDESDTTTIILEKLKSEIDETRKLDTNENNKKVKKQQTVEALQQKLQNAKLLEEKYHQKEKLLIEQKELIKQETTINDIKEKLKAAESAAKVTPFAEQARERKNEWIEEKNGLTKQQESVYKIQSDYEKISVSYNNQLIQEDARDQFKEAINKEKQQLEYIILYTKLNKETMKLKKLRDELQNKLTNSQNSITEMEESIEKKDSALENEQKIVKEYYELKEKCESAATLVHHLKRYNIENRKLAELRSKFKSTEATFKQEQAKLTSLREDLRKLEADQKTEYAAVLANQLKNGEPCPVCGSHEHPAIVKKHGEVYNSTKIEELEKNFLTQEKTVENFQNIYVNSKSEGQSQRLLVDKLTEEIKDKISDFDQTNSETTLSVWQNNYHQFKKMRDELSKQIEDLKHVKAQKEALKEEKQKVKQTFDQLTKNYHKTHDHLLKYESKVDELKKNIPGHVKDASEFEKEIDGREQKYQTWVQTWEKLKKDYQDSRETLQREKTILEEKRKTENRAKDNYTKQEKLLKQQLELCGFSTFENFQAARLSEFEYQKLEETVQTYEKRCEELVFTLRNIEQEIEERERPNLKVLEDELNIHQIELEEIGEKLQLLRIKLKNDQQILHSISEHFKKQQQLENDFYTIGDLAELAHGNNPLKLSFERYVLASFLDEIILQANLRLDRMSDHRYQLIRSGHVAKRGAQSGLDLEVLDHHTGQQRSVKTLSGGEGFKASLSLALGLADVVQTHAGGVQLDTLFIDEGFGTLDEESLQQAIDCLKDLQQSNRLLGIISHVPHLKNEIHAKLQITPSRNGSKFGFQFGKI